MATVILSCGFLSFETSKESSFRENLEEAWNKLGGWLGPSCQIRYTILQIMVKDSLNGISF